MLSPNAVPCPATEGRDGSNSHTPTALGQGAPEGHVLLSLLHSVGGDSAICKPARSGGWSVVDFTAAHIGLARFAGNKDIFISVNPVHADLVRLRNPHGRGSKRHRELSSYRAAHCEMDIGKPGYPSDLESALKVVNSLPVQPSVIVFTGGGIHCWWVLAEPILLSPDDDAAWERVLDIEARWKRLVCDALVDAGYITDDGDAGIDRGTFDLTRVLRLPGTVHGRRGVVVKEIGGTGELVSTVELLEVLPDPPKTSKQRDRAAKPHRPPVEDDDVVAFLEEHAVEPDCAYGRTAASTLAADMRQASERHPTAVRSAIRLVGLMETGCCYADDLLALRDAFFEAKPEADDAEWIDIVRWAVQQYHPREKGCDMHRGASAEDGTIEPVTLEDAHRVFKRWLGIDYDTDAIDLCLAAQAVEHLDGDPLWVLVVSGSGNAKTETVAACAQGSVTVSTISSAGALLSATAKKERAEDATGGLLRQLEPTGTLIVKDVTSILSMDRNTRGEVLAALREVYDGAWVRTVGVDGGRTLSWEGRIAFLGAVTTAWDQAHAVISAMGDRFVLLRLDSTRNRIASGRQAIGNTGSEDQMRAELQSAAAGVIAGMDTQPIELTEDEREVLLAAANLVTRSRTAVEFDYRGNVVDAHAPEMPTRFAKQLAQIVRGGVAIGMGREDALRLAVRAARDSMLPLRLAIIDDLAAHPSSTTGNVRKRIGKPRTTVDRQLQALNMLGVVEVDEDEDWDDPQHPSSGGKRTRWYYSLAADIDPDVIDVTRNVTTPASTQKAAG